MIHDGPSFDAKWLKTVSKGEPVSATPKTSALLEGLREDFPLRDLGDPHHRLDYYASAVERLVKLCKELEGAHKEPEKPAKTEPAPSAPTGTRVYRR